MENAIKKPTSLRLFLAALGSFMLLFSSAIVSNSTSYYIVAVTEELGITRAEFSIYYTLVSIFTAVGSVTCSAVLNKIGLRKAFLVATILVPAGFVVLSQLNALWMIYLAAILIGFGQAFILAPPVKVVNDWFPDKHNGLVMGITMAGTGAGGIIVAQVLPRVVANVSFRTGYIISAIAFAAFCLIANLLCGGKSPYAVEEAAPADGKKSAKKDASYAKNIASAAFILFVLSCVLKCFSAVFNQHFSAHLQENFSVEQVATAMTVFNIALLCCKTAQGVLYGKLGPKIMLGLVFLTSFAYLGWTSANYTVVLISTVFVMFCCSTETAMYPLFLGEMFGKKFSGAAWGICWASLYLGNALGAVIWGAIYDKFGTYNVGLRFQPVMIGVICAIILACLTIAKKQKLNPELSEKA